ncbi:hypothetical protein [Vibrio hyugaensis]|uniref:hypothetical protein n=1 Tax=Vibrio hyugaensis TaxID=1534743 RepID=UPI0006948B7E
MKSKKIAQEVLLDLSNRMSRYPTRSSERKAIVLEACALYGVSESTLYRQLRSIRKPKSLKRADAGQSRVIAISEMERYCEIIAALKLRTTNKNGRHISTTVAIDLLENTGVESEYGFIKPEKGKLNKTTLNRYLTQFGLDKHNLTKNTPDTATNAGNLT